MHVIINGEDRALPEGTTVADATCAAHPGGHGIAVAVNGEVVTRSAWDRHTLRDGDCVEVLGAAQGG